MPSHTHMEKGYQTDRESGQKSERPSHNQYGKTDSDRQTERKLSVRCWTQPPVRSANKIFQWESKTKFSLKFDRKLKTKLGWREGGGKRKKKAKRRELAKTKGGIRI